MARERIRADLRRHGVVLFGPFLRAFALAALGLLALALPWPVPLLGPLLAGVGAWLALSAVYRWDRTRLVVTDDKVVLVEGGLRRRASGIRLERIQSVEVEQSMPGRLLGYGTVVAGALRVEYVPEAREVAELLD